MILITSERIAYYAILMLLPVTFFQLGRNVRLGKGSDPVSNTYLSIVYACLFCIAFFGLYTSTSLSFLFEVRYLSVAVFVLMEFSLPILVIFSMALAIRMARSYLRKKHIERARNN